MQAQHSYDTMAALLKAMGHPARLQILEVLSEGEACVCHLEAVLGLRQAYISQQLMKLREAGLVTDRRAELYVYYSLTDPEIGMLLDMIHQTTQQVSGERLPLRRDLAVDVPCACPTCQSEPISTLQE